MVLPRLRRRRRRWRPVFQSQRRQEQKNLHHLSPEAARSGQDQAKEADHREPGKGMHRRSAATATTAAAATATTAARRRGQRR